MTDASSSSPDRLSGGAISRWTLRFSDSAVEREFDLLWRGQSLGLIRLWSLIGILVYVAFGLVEWWVYPANIGQSFALRYGLVLPIQLGFLGLTYSRWHSVTQAINLVLCTSLTNAAYLYLLAITPHPQQMIYYFMVLLIILFTHGFIGVRFVHSFVASYLTFFGYLAVMLLFSPVSAKTGAVLALVLFLAITISVFGNYNQELHLRRDFRLNKLLALQKRHSEELARRAMEANEAKSRFLAMMSHELRTPLNAIIGFSEIIAKQMFGPVQPERYRGYAADIDRSGRHLLGLINGILDLSRAAEGKLNLREDTIDIGDLLEQCRRMLEPRAEEAGLRLTLKRPISLLQLRGDERMVRQIVLNLLSNALKFTPSGGTVALGADQLEDGALTLTVADTGIGIAASDMEIAMTPFGQIDSSLARKYEGAGLGLPLSRTLIELHGGTLTLASEPGRGTTATVRFPGSRTGAVAARNAEPVSG